ncbi:HPr(Ser) kinase/phosphatase [bacterium]|nr:HPr(Ser) kinase/phosphatase [bacterium]
MNEPGEKENPKAGRVLDFIEVKQLFEDNEERLGFTLLAGSEGMKRQIAVKHVHRPGLALAGYIELFSYERIQILGNTEIFYLRGLDDDARLNSIKKVMKFDMPCLIITNGNQPPVELLVQASEHNVPVMGTNLSTTDLNHLLSDYLDDQFAPTISVHGSLVDVYGTGMLFTGRSGIGKSEIALDLVERGHRLVADDRVRIDKKAEGVLIGTAPEISRHIMEVRGVGLIDVKRMFGVRGIRVQKRVEVEVHLEEWDESYEWERIGLDYESTHYLGVEVPLLRLPIFPGKNISMIAEVIALQIHLRVYGMNPAEEMQRRMNEEMNRRRVKNYLIRDFE